MKTTFAAIALAAALAQPASATTFPSLTTIYVIAGVKNTNDATGVGTATAIQCSNVSGVSTDIRFLVLNNSGQVLASFTRFGVAHDATIEHSTHNTNAYTAEGVDLIPGIALSSGVLNIESLESAVFCTAAVIDAAAAAPVGITPHIIRVNPHPSTVE